MSIYVNRATTLLDLPLGNSVKVLHPESLNIRISESKTLDIGALCYLDRLVKSRRCNQKSRLVSLRSFDKKRAGRIRELIEYISDQKALGLRRHTTLHSVVRSWIRFIDWCDVNEYSSVLNEKQTSRVAFRAYVLYLTDRVRNGSLYCNTAANYQNHALELISEFVCENDVATGIKLIYKTSNVKQPTFVPDEKYQSQILSLCDCLFNGLHSLVVENKSFPFNINVPQYLNYNDNSLWVFPISRWVMAPQLLQIRDTLKQPFWAYDYKNGKVMARDDIDQYYTNKYSGLRAIDVAKKIIADANSDIRHSRRIQAAMTAHNVFLLMFIANTGMNEAQAINLRWSDDYDLGVETQGFREIKYRASNKMVSFQIGIRFLAVFRKFLALRKYILNNEAYKNHLFFSLGVNQQSVPSKTRRSLIDNVYITLRNIDPNLPKIMPRAWRAVKSDFLIRNTEPSTAALILQTSDQSVTKHYAEGSEVLAFDELGRFYERISHVVKQSSNNSEPNSSSSAVGGCSDYGKPNAVDNSIIKSDCHQAEGCLFCDKYIVHADEKDVRKLLSCKYCIDKTSHLSASKEHFESIYGEIIRRIEMLIEYISELSEEHSVMVKKVSEEVVEDGNLDSYWLRKLEMLSYLGVIGL